MKGETEHLSSIRIKNKNCRKQKRRMNMNKLILIGRLTKDVELKYTPSNQTAVTSFTLAVDRKAQKGKERRQTS